MAFDQAAYSREYYHRNPAKYAETRKRWVSANREKINAKNRQRRLSRGCKPRNQNPLRPSWKRNANNPEVRMKKRLAQRIRNALQAKGTRKLDRTTKLIGCTMPEFMDYLQSKFTSGMAWNNRHLWHIDHIRPCSSFNLLDPEEQKKCFHYTNLRPLWAKDNQRKNNKMEVPYGV